MLIGPWSAIEPVSASKFRASMSSVAKVLWS
jgi:hypothetical protein